MITLKGQVLSKFESEDKKFGAIEILGKNGTGYKVYKVRLFENQLDFLKDVELEKPIEVPISINLYKNNIQYNLGYIG